MALSEIDSFVFKFKNLVHFEKDAKLSIESKAGKIQLSLSVELNADLVSAPSEQKKWQRNCPSRQRRRERRAAARNSVEESSKYATIDDNIKAEKATNSVVSDIAEEAELAKNATENGIAEEDKLATDVIGKEVLVMHLNDEVCSNDVYKPESVSICSVDIFPKKYNCLTGLEPFRAKIEDYFMNRKDVIKRVIKCEIVNHGNNVRLVVEVNIKRGWIFFFCDPEANYRDLYEDCIGTLRHSCLDLSNCDKG